jgi:hypothetical protein
MKRIRSVIINDGMDEEKSETPNREYEIAVRKTTGTL